MAGLVPAIPTIRHCGAHLSEMRGTSPRMTEWERVLEHDPEKWTPVFGKDHAPPTS
jgi:hypothetical protein